MYSRKGILLACISISTTKSFSSFRRQRKSREDPKAPSADLASVSYLVRIQNGPVDLAAP